MPSVSTHYGTATYQVLIPTKGRDVAVARMFKKMPWLADPGTVIGVDAADWAAYGGSRVAHPQCTWVKVVNPAGSVAVAREQLRAWATVQRPTDYYVVTDDNAVHGSHQALEHLVRCLHEYQGSVGRPAIVAGMHNTALHFDRGKIKYAKTLWGLRSYPAVAMIFQVYPHVLYAEYRYPADAYGLDDRHFFLWCIARGVTDFRVCMDAPFTKSRYQDGGQGTIRERMVKTGHAIARLAVDFPGLVGATGTLRIPWQFLLEMGQDGDADRLVGGAMRKETSIIKKKTGVPVRVRRREASPTDRRDV